MDVWNVLRRARLAACALLGSMVMLTAAAPAQGAVGDYTVTVTGTSGWPGWSHVFDDSDYIARDMRVETSAGGYGASTFRRWHLTVPHRSVRISGGRIRGTTRTPNDAFVATVRMGDFGGAVIRLVATDDSTSFDRALDAHHDWLEFGLHATERTTVGTDGANHITLTALSVNLHDSVVPELSVPAEPDAEAWHGPACVPFTVRATDYGSGIASLTVRNVTTGAQLRSWTDARVAGLRPGRVASERSSCIAPAEAVHGVNVYELGAADVSGRRRTALLRLRHDLQGPVVSGLPEDAAAFDEPRPPVTFTVADGDSGLASVRATLDGEPVELEHAEGRYRVLWSSPLAVGVHRLSVHASDTVGNESVTTRSFSVGDVTPPVVTVSSPGASGGTDPWLSAGATDAGSEIDPSTWRVSVNGVPLGFSVVGSTVFGPVGTLVEGGHVITLSVADTHGNRATLEHAYRVDGAASMPGAPAMGGGSGVSVGGAPAGPVTYGRTVRIGALAARHGRPLVGYRVVARVGGVTAASAVTDAQGLVELAFVARRSGRVEVLVAGLELPLSAFTLRVAPRISLRVSDTTPRRGQAVVVSGRVSPALSGRRVVVLARIGDAWYPVRRVTVGRYGRYRTTVASAVRGTIAVRVRMNANAQWAAGYSNVRVLTVR